MFERTEYPRPQFRRREWLSLNGEWEFAFDDEDRGLFEGYDTGNVPFPMKINVPFSYQYAASGVGENAPHERVWYRRKFTPMRGRRALLCFNGADYAADVWVNGRHAVSHEGGYTPFSADVTALLCEGENTIVVRCTDPFDPAVPRGKQSWTGERFGCWYLPNTGIWQSVWIDYFGDDCIESYRLVPDYDACSVSGEISTLRGVADEGEIAVFFGEKQIKKTRFTLDGRRTRYALFLTEPRFPDPVYAWSPERPTLLGAVFRLYRNGVCVDEAHTRFGLRKISAEGGEFCLNGKPFYQRLVLDQGYWQESGLTPPSAEALKRDIELAKAMGFNGARKHQKWEDPYFYYYAEELGFVAWCEMPSAYGFCTQEAERLLREWNGLVLAARNFTSVVCYVPLNESWGAENLSSCRIRQSLARALYHSAKALDGTRPVSTNDGWECMEESDVIGVHDYAAAGTAFEEKYRRENYDALFPQGRRLMCGGEKYAGQPVLLTEFGGIAMSGDMLGENWGYNGGAESEEEFYARYADLLGGIARTAQLKGFCYTQLTDVQQEVNGLLFADRTPKFDLARIRALTESVKNTK